MQDVGLLPRYERGLSLTVIAKSTLPKSVSE